MGSPLGFRRALLLAVSFLALPALAASTPVPAETPVAAGVAPEVTVYPGDLALVRERRVFRLNAPESRLAFTGVSRQLRPDTVALSVNTNQQVKASEVRLLDQTFAFNVVSQQSLLEQSVGKEVSVVTTNPATGRDVTERATVVAVQNGLVLDIGGKIYTDVPGRIVFDGIPPNLRAQPTLLVTAAGPVGKDVDGELTYLTSGLGWSANYVARYDSEGSRLDLTAWATVNNTTGLDFKDAKLKLAAGEVNTVNPPPRPYMAKAMRAEAMVAAAPAMDAGAAQSLDNLHLYPITRPTTLMNGESKQLMLLQLVNVPVKRDVIVRGEPWYYLQPLPGQPQVGSAEVEISLKNEAAKPLPKGSKEPAPAPSGLGQSLPAGVVRAYGDDNDGRLQFLGEDSTKGAAAGEEIKLRLGHDADIPVTRDQVSFVRATEAITVTTWRMTIRNGKSKPMTVRVEEPVSGNWEIARTNIPNTKSETGLPTWNLTIPAKGQAVLDYSIKAGTGVANTPPVPDRLPQLAPQPATQPMQSPPFAPPPG
jgi:hypothetical protein